MESKKEIQWKKLYDFILACGNIHEPYQFAVNILQGLKIFCTFDQALIYFLDGNRKVFNQYLMNVDKQWSNMYLEYYSKIAAKEYRVSQELYETCGQRIVSIIDWRKESDNEFVSNYVHSRGLKYSLGFALYDLNGIPRTIFSLDKKKSESFSDSEIGILELLIPQLNNLHKNFFACSDQSYKTGYIWESAGLTKREIEVVSMLCQGISPAHISKSLRIAPSTTYRHIANIYTKMHVSSQQELLVRLLNQQR